MVNTKWINTLRGGAALCVIFTHFIPYITKYFHVESKICQALTVGILDTGKIGVALLFIISGYLVPTSKQRRNIKEFIINRVFRLYPTYWFDILLVGLLFNFDGYGLDTILANITMLQVFIGKEDLVGLFWTMPIEILLYFFVILFEKYLWYKKGIIRLLALSTTGTIALSLIRKFIWSSAPVAIGLLLSIALIGQIARLYIDNKTELKILIKGVLIFIVCLFISCILAYQSDNGHQESWYRYFLSYTCAITAFIFFMMTKKNFSLLNYIATISYPLYLLQEIAFRVAFDKIGPHNIRLVPFSIATISALFLISWILHKYLEEPLIKVGKIIESKLHTTA